MDNSLVDRLKKTKYFTENNIEIKSGISIGDDSYKLDTKGKAYELILHDTKDQLDLDSEISHKKLIEIGASPRHTYELGLFADMDKTYTIREYRHETSLGDYLAASDDNKAYELGLDFGKLLSNIHTTTTHTDADWYKVFNTKANYLFYMHGVSEVGDKDYIIIDYINHNKHLAKNIKTSYLYQNLDSDHIFILDDGSFNLEGLGFNIIGDPVYDFTQINKLALLSEPFARGVLDSYFKGTKIPIKFFRLLALYEAYEILEAIVKIRNNEPSSLTKQEIDQLLIMFDNFNTEQPIWR